MVNLAFCRLDGSLSDLLWQLRSTTFIYFHLYPFQRDDHLCWNFVIDLLRTSDRCFPNIIRIYGHLLFVFRFQERSSFSDPEGRSMKMKDHGSWFRYAGCCWYHEGFFQTTAGVRSDRGRFIFELFGFFWFLRQILVTSVPLYYFDLKSDWLPFETVAFGSPPEDLLMLYLLFVPIE